MCTIDPLFRGEGKCVVTFLNFNIDGIKKSIEENEKNGGKTCLYEKVLDNQVWPWMGYK